MTEQTRQRSIGAGLNGATNSILAWTNVQPAQAGSYQVIVTNGAGAATSAVAMLRVLVAPRLGSVSAAQTPVSVFFNSVTGLTYALEYKNALTDSNWTALLPTLTGTGGTLYLQDTNVLAPSRFYRVRCN